jgi:hypothetical protein
MAPSTVSKVLPAESIVTGPPVPSNQYHSVLPIGTGNSSVNPRDRRANRPGIGSHRARDPRQRGLVGLPPYLLASTGSTPVVDGQIDLATIVTVADLDAYERREVP